MDVSADDHIVQKGALDPLELALWVVTSLSSACSELHFGLDESNTPLFSH